MSAFPVRYISGLEPNKLSSTTIEFNRGSITEANGTEGFDFENETTLDLSTNGLWGMDTGSPANGDSIQLYLISDGANHGLIATKEITHNTMTMPTGFSFKRKFPWAFVYNSTRDGIPNFHISSWPQPFVRFTDAEYDSKWRCLTDGVSTSWTEFDLSPWLPDNARMAYIQTRVESNGSSAASSYLRSGSTQSTGLLVGSVGSNSPWETASWTIRTTSERKLYYKCSSSNAKLNVFVLGFGCTGVA